MDPLKRLSNFMESSYGYEYSKKDKAKVVDFVKSVVSDSGKSDTHVYALTAFIDSYMPITFATGIFDKMPDLKAIQKAAVVYCLNHIYISQHALRAMMKICLTKEELKFEKGSGPDIFGNDAETFEARVRLDANDELCIKVALMNIITVTD